MLATMTRNPTSRTARGGTKATTVKTRRPPAEAGSVQQHRRAHPHGAHGLRPHQSDLSRRIGVRSQSVNQWEGGHKQPSRSSIVALARCATWPQIGCYSVLMP